MSLEPILRYSRNYLRIIETSLGGISVSELKTKKTDSSVDSFVDSLPDEQVRAETHAIIDVFRKAVKAEPAMWGPSIIGFGTCTLKYSSGRVLDWMEVGFSPRKGKFAFYIKSGFPEFEELAAKLGKYSQAKGCLYAKKVSDIDLSVMGKIAKASVTHFRKHGYNA